MDNQHIALYQTPDGKISIDVKLGNETIWLSQAQIADLFGTQIPAISEHLSNIFTTNELDINEVCAVLEHTATDGKKHQTPHYNLDVILSIGYRVNTKNAALFRSWVNKIIKDHLILGYSINEERLKEKEEQYTALKQVVYQLGNVIDRDDESTGLLKVITDYTYALDILDRYDHRTLTIEATHQTATFTATYENALSAIDSLRDKFGGSWLFGNQKDDSFKSSIANIYQSFGGNELYPSIEEKAAHLLYFVVKNHSFSDGNKRIAAFLFIWFLEKNNILYRKDGAKRIADNALVALTLMIAESKSEEKDIMAQVVVSLINDYN